MTPLEKHQACLLISDLIIPQLKYVTAVLVPIRQNHSLIRIRITYKMPIISALKLISEKNN